MKIYRERIKNGLTKYWFGNISMLDIQNYLFTNGYSKKEFWVYRENLKLDDDDYQDSFDTYLRSHVVKKQELGNAIMFLSKHINKEKFKGLFEKILNGSDEIDMSVFDDIELVCYSHDFDWLVIAISKDESLLNDFISYISQIQQVEEIKELNGGYWVN